MNEDVVRLISSKKNEPEFLLEWRLRAFLHWQTMKEPTWANITYPPIEYQDIVYYSAPKQQKDGPKSLDEVDPKLLETYEKLGIPLQERAALAGVAPIPASSGQVTRHRLNRGGDRQLNRALHVIVLSRLQYHDETKAYMDRRISEGKSYRETRRCLKRFVARRLFKLLESTAMAA